MYVNPFLHAGEIKQKKEHNKLESFFWLNFFPFLLNSLSYITFTQNKGK